MYKKYVKNYTSHDGKQERGCQAMATAKVFGYARVSTAEQHLDRQIKALHDYGIADDCIFADKISGMADSRPALDDLLSRLRDGDTVVVSSFDRLARSTKQLLELSEHFANEGVNLVSLKEQIDTSTPQGKLFFTISSAFAEFERAIIKERQAEGQAIAKSKGVRMGRPKVDGKDADMAMELFEKSAMTVADIARACNMSRQSVYNLAKERGITRTNER